VPAGGSEEDVRARLAAAWKKWHDLTSVLCDQRMSVAVKGKVCRTRISQVLIYGAEAWTLRRREEELERTETRMLRWILGLTLNDRKRNNDICRAISVACATDKAREARLRWYGHVQQRQDDYCVKGILEADVYGQRSR